MWTDFDGKPYSREAFQALLDDIPSARLKWCKFICVHNTAAPSLTQWMSGAATPAQRIVNLQRFYEKERGWSAGPHAFIPPDPAIAAYCFTKFTRPGVHASCFNNNSIGLEMVGDFEREEFTFGDGGIVRDNAIFVLAALHLRLGLRPDGFELGKSGLHFHVDCKRDNHACPGKKVNREALVNAVLAEMDRQTHGVPVATVSDPSLGVGGAVAGAVATAVTNAPSEPMTVAETVADDKPSWFSRLFGWVEKLDVYVLDRISGLGSRSASAINTGKKLLVRGGATVAAGGGTAAALVDPNKGTAAIANSWASEHPMLLAFLCILATMLVVGGIAYYFLRTAGKGLIEAHADKRYLTRTEAPPPEAAR